MKSFCSIFLLLLSSSCALPPPDVSRQNYVASKEIAVIDLVRDGLSLYDSGRLIDAELKLRQALYLVPQENNIKFNLAVILEKEEKYEEAASIFQKLLTQKPEDIKILSALAHLNFARGDLLSSEQFYGKILDLYERRLNFSRAADVYRSLSSINFSVGEEQDALCYSEMALKLNPDDKERGAHLKIMLALNRLSEASKLILVLKQSEKKAPIVQIQEIILNFAEGNHEHAKELLGDLLTNSLAANNFPYEVSLLTTLIKYLPDNNKASLSTEEQDYHSGGSDKNAIDPEQRELDYSLMKEALERENSVYLPYQLLTTVVDTYLEVEPKGRGN